MRVLTTARFVKKGGQSYTRAGEGGSALLRSRMPRAAHRPAPFCLAYADRKSPVPVLEEYKMPYLLRDRDISSDSETLHSALIIPCSFCPAANIAVRESKPYIDLFRNFLRTDSYESYIKSLQTRLETNGIKTGVFDSKLPYQFIMCMWTSGRREALAKQSANYDAFIVLGCDAAVDTARNSLKSGKCRVIPGMELEGIMNVIPTLKFPFNISLEVNSVTRLEVNSQRGDGTQ